MTDTVWATLLVAALSILIGGSLIALIYDMKTHRKASDLVGDVEGMFIVTTAFWAAILFAVAGIVWLIIHLKFV